MRRIFVVGCGGTGGAVVGHAMDMIGAELRRIGVDTIPGCWQFVHVDVPLSSDVKGPRVETMGGRYISTCPPTGKYAPAQEDLVTRLSSVGQGGEVAEGTSWLSRAPESLTLSLWEGAGQMRAVGRVATLATLPKLVQGLRDAWLAMDSMEATSQASALSAHWPIQGAYQQGKPPLVLIVTSTAGGAGASMALDLSRVISSLPGADPGLVAVFAATAEAFSGIAAQELTGVRPNALAMLGEVVAAQSRASGDHDAKIFQAAGLARTAEGVGLGRVFPFGNSVGMTGTLFGDGKQQTIQRGLGRALGALVVNSQAQEQLTAFSLTNSNPVQQNRQLFGWGGNRTETQWASFGYSSVSMGRDRYLEYAAQRLASSSLDHLRRGHLPEGAEIASEAAAAADLVQARWPQICARLGLPVAVGEEHRSLLQPWVRETFAPMGEIGRDVVKTRLVPHLPTMGQAQADHVRAGLSNALRAADAGMVAGTKDRAAVFAQQWMRGLCDRVEALVAEEAGTAGLSYVQVLLDRVADLFDGLAAELRWYSRQTPQSPADLPQKLRDLVGSLKGVLASASGVLDEVAVQMPPHVSRYAGGVAAALMADILAESRAKYVAPLRASATQTLQSLELAVDDAATDGSERLLAQVRTDRYRSWPKDGDGAIDPRWSSAENESLLTPADDFAGLYRTHLASVAGASSTFGEGRAHALKAIISGEWEAVRGQVPPGAPLELLTAWVPVAMQTDPLTGQSRLPSGSKFALHLSPAEILERARAFVNRPGGVFKRFEEESLHDYVVAAGETPAEQQDRLRRFRRALEEALRTGMPLISVDSESVRVAHNGSQASVRYNIGGLPFHGHPEIQQVVVQAFSDVVGIDQTFITQTFVDSNPFGTADSPRIDLFGAYPNYAPVVYRSSLEPIAEQWRHRDSDFWHMRRTRPLPAALPMSPDERRAMVGGWFVSQLVGALRIPDDKARRPVVQILDEHPGGYGESPEWVDKPEWVDFPHELLSPPPFFKPFDWLPAILESSLLAIARFSEPPIGDSMRPYRVLREWWDVSPDGPLVAGALRGEQVVRAWADGTSIEGARDKSRVLATADHQSSRAMVALDWLAKVEHAVEALTPVSPRAMRTAPLMIDLRDDVLSVTGQLRGWLARGGGYNGPTF